MRPEERRRIEEEIHRNGLDDNDVAFSVKALALLNFHNITEMKAEIQEIRSIQVTKKDVTVVVGAGALFLAVVDYLIHLT